MSKKKLQIIIGVALAISAVIAVLVCFSDMFTSGDDKYGSATVFNYMFNYPERYNGPIPGLIVAFCFQCVAFLLAFVAMPFEGKLGGLILGIAGLLMVAAGVLFSFSIPLYEAVNPAPAGYNPNLGLSYGPICSLIFSFLGGLLGLFGAYKAVR